ncbi:MAG TPA: cobalamin-binding protein [Bryobacteraceae bacterium]|nr:cobalamin-binding protein [Bryobacteraceae bacterium]
MTRRRAALGLVATALLAGAANPPQRIVSTTPSITEILYALGLGDRVVGVTRFCRYPPEAMLKPKIGDYINPDLEAIAALRPDLVVVQTNPVRLAERLNALHLRTLEVDQQDIAGIDDSIRAIGAAAGVSPRADQLIAKIRAGLDEVRARSAKLQAPRVMFVVGRASGRLDGLVVVGRASYLNDVIRIAGGENIFRDAAAAYPQVSMEEVLARNPEVILDMGEMSDEGTVSEREQRETVALWTRRLPSLAAVEHHRVFPIVSEMYVIPGPRVVDAARAIFAMLHTGAEAK